MMSRLQMLLLLAITFLSGCGEVVVFGHVVREGSTPAKVEPAGPSPAQTATSPGTTTEPVTTTTAATVPPPAVAASASQEPVQSPVVQQVKAVALSFTPEVTAKLATDSRFSNNELLSTLKAELQLRGLLAATGNNSADSQTGTTLVVYIDNYDLHATTNFVIFGSTPHTGTLAGNLVLRDEQGETTPLSHVEAYSRISVPEGDAPKNLLQPLYHEFATTVANSFAGAHMTSGADKDQPR